MPRIARLLVMACLLLFSAPTQQRSLAQPVAPAAPPAALASGAPAAPPAALASAVPLARAVGSAALTSTSPITANAVELIGQNGGAIRTIATVGTYAYLAVNLEPAYYFGRQSEILVLDISNPQTPVPVGRSQRLNMRATALVIIKGYLYLW